jgi:hypothetical protein
MSHSNSSTSQFLRNLPIDAVDGRHGGFLMAIDTDTTFRRDINTLPGYEGISTTSALAKIAQDANGGSSTPVVHASDKSYDELVAEYRGVGANKAEIVDGLLEGAHVGAEVVGVEFAGAALAATAGPVIGLALGMYKLAEANQRGHELHTALVRDEQRVALLTNTALPAAFVKSELEKYSHAGTRFDSGNQKLTTLMHGQDHALTAVLQLHTDQGMTSALDMISGGQPKEAFFAAHPEVAKRYADDIAFKNGFDAMVYTKEHDPASYDKTVGDLRTRDGWYSAAGLAVRG